jgi:hypothetical protein
MKKDFEIPKVEQVAVAIMKEAERDDDEWGVYLINLKDVAVNAAKPQHFVITLNILHPTPLLRLNQ